MHIVRSKFKPSSGKTYETILLRESYRDGKKVKKRTVANLSKCSPGELAAIELALQHKADLSNLGSIKSVSTTEGLSVGGVWAIYETAKRLGIVDALGKGRQGQLALWQVIARVLEQGSRLSSVRLAETYAIASVIGLEDGFYEDDLYKNLFWLAQNQARIEDDIFEKRFCKNKPTLFLYDVTSSYLEGQENELADWGYNRDKKKGKKQIVLGLLCEEDGTPVTTEVFKGNTQDLTTFASQVRKAKERFRCQKVTFVGDRGMIKSGQIDMLHEHGFHYITAITKKHIETLIKQNVIEYSLFDNAVTEVVHDGVRYIFRRNPMRAQEIANTRIAKQNSVEKLLESQNMYLREHPKAKEKTAFATISAKLKQLGLTNWLSVVVEGRVLSLIVDDKALKDESRLDGCYVIKSDLAMEDVDAKTIHARYKDLAFVESAFRSIKSDLDIRPVYVYTEESTRAHALVVMLAYMITKELERAWSDLYLTVEEGIRSLSTLCMINVSLKSGMSFQQIPRPRQHNQCMLEALGIELPKILPHNSACVVTRKNRRKTDVKN